MEIVRKSVRITLDNVLDYPRGTRVLFDYGALCGEEEGTITGWEETCFGVQLLARTDDGSLKSISSFNDVGIGVYVLKDNSKDVKKQINKNSPWYRGYE